MWEYLAGIFDVRGFIQVNLTKDKKGRTKFNVYFNFTDKDLKTFLYIHDFLNKHNIKNSIYKASRVRNRQEYQLYITSREGSKRFLENISQYSFRQREILQALGKLTYKP